MVLVDSGAVTEQLALAARSNMLCCGGRKEGSTGGTESVASPRRQSTSKQNKETPNMVVQSDFRKISGISSEIFRQIENIENDHDASTAAAFEAVERRGEMVVRLLDYRVLSRQAYEQAKRFISLQNSKFSVQMVEIVKRPGQTLGLYIREGNGADRADGVFISRIALESPVYNSGCLRVMDEILAVNLVDVTRMGLDDVVIIMSIPRRLLLTTRSFREARGMPLSPGLFRQEPNKPVVVIKKDYAEDDEIRSYGPYGSKDSIRMSQMPQMPRMGQMPHSVMPIHQDGRFSTLPRSYRPPDAAMTNYRNEEFFYNPRPSNVPALPPRYDMNRPLPIDPISSRMIPIGQHATLPNYHQSRSSSRQGYTTPTNVNYGPSIRDHDRYYQPPPPVITEQPRPQTQHFNPYDRFYPKTLESLAEKIHSFYGPIGPLGPETQSRLQNLSNSFAYGTLGRHNVRRPRLARTLSDQRLPDVERETMSDFEGATITPRKYYYSRNPNFQNSLLGEKASLEKYQDTMMRLSALRNRTRSVDYASDTEVTIPRSSLLHRTKGLQMAAIQSRSNSLPRHATRHRVAPSPMRFDGRSSRLELSGDESDGALSAPEMASAVERVAARRARMVPSRSVYSSDEYRAWMTRAPSTSAIYERIRQTHDTQKNEKPMRFTFSAENLSDRSRDELPFFGSRRIHLPSAPLTARTPTGRMSRQETNSAATRRVRAALEETRGVPQPSPTRGQTALRLLDINPSEFIKYKNSVGNVPAGIEGISGILWVHLLAGRGLKVSSKPELRDLYCVLESDRVHKARTVVRTGDHNFDWDETFDLDLINNKELDFLIYSWDPQFRHKLCYKGSIQMVTLLNESPMHQLALKIEPRGTLYLKLRYTAPQQSFLRTPSIRKNALFGVDLEGVCQRESSGTWTPLIIARCVSEVERRGLDIIGLYRLCGSATKKRLLRDAFERNPRLVDLSSDNVPDINVITGILKDYLRELPEPLFTKCLYQMLVDALTVMLPDDPDGNAKLIFSILDCLPKVNKHTLFLLVDHLHLVSSQSERNKMTTQNLAICFGPVLMLQSDPGVGQLDFHQPISILKFLLDMWPTKSTRESVFGRSRRGSLIDPERRKDRGATPKSLTARSTPKATPKNLSPGSESEPGELQYSPNLSSNTKLLGYSNHSSLGLGLDSRTENVGNSLTGMGSFTKMSGTPGNLSKPAPTSCTYTSTMLPISSTAGLNNLDRGSGNGSKARSMNPNHPNVPIYPNLPQYSNIRKQPNYSNQPNSYSNEPNKYSNLTTIYSTQSNSYPNQSNSYSNQSNNYSNESSKYSNQPNSYPNQPSSYCNQPNSYPNQQNNFSGQTNNISNQPNNFSSQPNSFYNQFNNCSNQSNISNHSNESNNFSNNSNFSNVSNRPNLPNRSNLQRPNQHNLPRHPIRREEFPDRGLEFQGNRVESPDSDEEKETETNSS